MATDNLTWAHWPWERCKAVREPRGGWGRRRCDLRKGHDGDHALEQGMDTPRWSTDWAA